MRAKIAVGDGTMVLWDAVDVPCTPFFVNPMTGYAGGSQCWVVSHRPTGIAFGGHGWLTSDLAVRSIIRWWNLLSRDIQILFETGTEEQIQKVDVLVPRMLFFTCDVVIHPA